MQPPFSRDGSHETMSGTSFPPRRKPLVLLTSALTRLSLLSCATAIGEPRVVADPALRAVRDPNEGSSLGDGFQLSNLGTCAHHSVPQIFYQAPTMCWEQPPTLPWPLMEDVESTFSSAGIWQPWCFSPREVCCLIKHLFFF